ncbi:MAG: hypothetical protein HRU29_14190 [Rhizobiales bacterium]|nr:hypothetical protein [Hyphomicrobiales bacterium]NRB15544.1 hypothetical protein [Hyphomicrobiales bacterium]
MKKYSPILLATIVLALLYYFKVAIKLSLAHAWWHTNATLIAASIGLVIGLLLIWLKPLKPEMAKWLERGLVLTFVIATYITYAAGREFIDSAVFEARAGQVWHIGYYVTVATFIITFSHIYKAVRGKLSK